MAYRSMEAKVIETIKFSCLPSYPDAISWSLDDRVSIITDKCVYILTLTLSPTRFGVDPKKTNIPGCQKNREFNVGIDKKQLSNVESIEWRLDPKVNQSILACSSNGFLKVAWSPLNCEENGRCIIAALFSEYQLCIYLSPVLGTKWKEAIDISQEFSGYLAKNSNELGQDVMQKTDWQNVSRSGTKNCGSHKNQYSVFKQRTEILAFTCLHWFSQLYQSREDVSLNNTEGIINDKKFAVLGVGNRSGAVMFWKVMVPVKVDKAIVQLGGILNTGQSWPSSLSWKETNLNQGLLAVGSTDGLIKIFSLKLLPSISGIAEYVLWGDKDDMQVLYLDWLHSWQTCDDLHYLVACKGSSVIVFSVVAKNDILTQKPSYKIIQGIHKMPITGLACTQNGTIHTCSLDGSVQTTSVDSAIASAVSCAVKKGFTCSGIGVSANGVFIALFLSPSNHTQQYLESHQIHIRFVNIVWGSNSVERLLNSNEVQLDRKWDVCKAIQHNMYYSKKLPEPLQLVSTGAMEGSSFAVLAIMQYALTVMRVISQQQEDDLAGNQVQQLKWAAQLEWIRDYIYKRLVSATLNSWLEGRKAGTVSPLDSVPALIMCDWLVTKGIDSAVTDMVIQGYEACNDIEGLKKVLSHTVKSHENGKESSSGLLLQTGKATENQSVIFQSNAKAVKSQVNDKDQTLTGVTDESFTLLTREQCPLCQTAIAVESLEYGICLSGHRWPRCCVSFVICAELKLRRCQDCNRCVSTPNPGSSPWLRSLLKMTKCPFCLGFFQ